jgi:uncharacterized protein
MPRFSPDPVASGPSIRGFSGGGFLIDADVYPGGALLTPESATGWDAPALDALTPDTLASILERSPAPEFLLLGTGAQLRRPPRAFVTALEGRAIGVEAMDSRAAAHAWGVLRAEGREIVCALMPLGA